MQEIEIGTANEASREHARDDDGQSVSLLVVDDSPYVLKAICRILESVPEIEVTTARDGVEALKEVRRAVPDLMLVDFQMPRMNGLEVTRWIKSYAPETEIVMMSVHEQEGVRDASRESGADAFFVKNRLYRSLLPELGARFPQLSVWIR